MLHKKIFFFTLFISLFNNQLVAEQKITDLSDFNGNWHLRVMDGMEVRKARAILDCDSKKLELNGFDGCNRISGALKRTTEDRFFTTPKTTRMACRGSIQRYVSKRLHETVRQGFSITEAKRYGVNGITIKSPRHELFFGRMGK